MKKIVFLDYRPPEVSVLLPHILEYRRKLRRACRKENVGFEYVLLDTEKEAMDAAKEYGITGRNPLFPIVVYIDDDKPLIVEGIREI